MELGIVPMKNEVGIVPADIPRKLTLHQRASLARLYPDDLRWLVVLFVKSEPFEPLQRPNILPYPHYCRIPDCCSSNLADCGLVSVWAKANSANGVSGRWCINGTDLDT